MKVLCATVALASLFVFSHSATAQMFPGNPLPLRFEPDDLCLIGDLDVAPDLLFGGFATTNGAVETRASAASELDAWVQGGQAISDLPVGIGWNTAGFTKDLSGVSNTVNFRAELSAQLVGNLPALAVDTVTLPTPASLDPADYTSVYWGGGTSFCVSGDASTARILKNARFNSVGSQVTELRVSLWNFTASAYQLESTIDVLQDGNWIVGQRLVDIFVNYHFQPHLIGQVESGDEGVRIQVEAVFSSNGNEWTESDVIEIPLWFNLGL